MSKQESIPLRGRPGFYGHSVEGNPTIATHVEQVRKGLLSGIYTVSTILDTVIKAEGCTELTVRGLQTEVNDRFKVRIGGGTARLWLGRFVDPFHLLEFTAGHGPSADLYKPIQDIEDWKEFQDRWKDALRLNLNL